MINEINYNDYNSYLQLAINKGIKDAYLMLKATPKHLCYRIDQTFFSFDTEDNTLDMFSFKLNVKHLEEIVLYLLDLFDKVQFDGKNNRYKYITAHFANKHNLMYTYSVYDTDYTLYTIWRK